MDVKQRMPHFCHIFRKISAFKYKERLATDQKAWGSNPYGCTIFLSIFRCFEFKLNPPVFFTILPDSIKFLPHQKNGNKHVGYKACRSKASTGCSIAFPVFIVFPAMPHGKQAFSYIKDRHVPILVGASPATRLMAAKRTNTEFYGLMRTVLATYFSNLRAFSSFA